MSCSLLHVGCPLPRLSGCPVTRLAPNARHAYPDVRAPTRLTDDELAFLRSVLDLAREGRTAKLQEAVERGIPVNLTSGAGDSLLILAAYHDHPDTVRMLLEHGADPHRVNDRGQTALGAAVFRRSAPSTRLLLDHGADPHEGGRSAAEIAAFFELDEMSALLTTAPGAGQGD